MKNPIIKLLNEDFIVREVYLTPKFEEKHNSTCTYIQINKQGITTFEAETIISKKLNLSLENISTSGLKDEDAITTQIGSIKGIFDSNDFLNIDDNITILVLGYGNSVVKPRLLHGNCFNITIRNIDCKLANEIHNKYENGKIFSLVNYYDYQRFGKKDGIYNNHIIGNKLSNKYWSDAILEIEQDKVNTNINEPKNLLNKYNHKIIDFYGYSYLSSAWNKKVSTIIHEKHKDCIPISIVDDMDVFIIRNIESQTIQNICSVKKDIYNISIDENISSTVERNIFISTRIFSKSCIEDLINKDKYCLDLEFFLPTGVYATMLVKQLLLNYDSTCNIGANITPNKKMHLTA